MRLPIFLLLLLGLSACSWFKEKIEEPKQLTSHSNNIFIRERWQRDVGKGLGDLYHVIKPAVTSETVFANDIEGRVYAFDRETGKRKWAKHLMLDLSSGPGLGQTVVLFGSLNGDVVALNQSNGEQIWRVNITSEIMAPPQTNGQVVVVQTNEGKLYGLDYDTGKFLWRYSAKLPLLTIRGTATPQIFGNNLITGFANGKIVALSATDGVPFWERRIAYPRGKTEIARVVDVDGNSIVNGETVYSTSYNGHITAIAPDGYLRWTEKVSSHQSPLVVDGRVFVTAYDGVVHAYDAATGLELWKNNLLLYRKVSAPQSVAGFVVVSDYQGYIHVFDPELGVIIGRSRFDKEGIRSPMVSDGTYLYALGNDGELSSISLHLRGTRQQIEAQEESAKRRREEQELKENK
ncbi:outer membrane protein assembly factor BamB [Candidatus Endobugula sertula]|uniref:Outer membrane protein assembly factor BamB n=1 Tax=Candidatus Endobugula sertula TaxID=62101 RepID=A0A1D2QLP5_9GAMM|nr:outer membrane protein assembly factor BamB [Candidatus Endobugula sertula]